MCLYIKSCSIIYKGVDNVSSKTKPTHRTNVQSGDDMPMIYPYHSYSINQFIYTIPFSHQPTVC